MLANENSPKDPSDKIPAAAAAIIEDFLNKQEKN